MTMGRKVPVSAFVVFTALTGLAYGCNDKSLAAAPDAAARVLVPSDAGDSGTDAAPSKPDAGVLEDTAMPASQSEDLSLRMHHLLEALSQNNPDLASDALFPRDAYVTVKDSPDPQKAWEKRVSNAFRRSVERTHKKVKGIDHAKFVSFEVGRAVVQLTPKKKDFKRPLWRVKHSKLTVTIDGKTRHLDIAEMTAWRGAWYVTKLR